MCVVNAARDALVLQTVTPDADGEEGGADGDGDGEAAFEFSCPDEGGTFTGLSIAAWPGEGDCWLTPAASTAHPTATNNVSGAWLRPPHERLAEGSGLRVPSAPAPGMAAEPLHAPVARRPPTPMTRVGSPAPGPLSLLLSSPHKLSSSQIHLPLLLDLAGSRQGLTLVHVRAQLEQLQDTFMSYFGSYGGQRSSS
jgi:hypothetical protein